MLTGKRRSGRLSLATETTKKKGKRAVFRATIFRSHLYLNLAKTLDVYGAPLSL